MAITILNERELRDCVRLDEETVDAVADAFTALARGGVVMPPIVHLHMPDKNGEMDVKTAYVPGFDSFALKVSTGFFDNPKKGLPSLSGLMNLIDADTGQVRAVLLDNGYLTDVRTAAAGAVAARHCAREDAKVAGVLGTGLQARLQIEALMLVRPIEQVLVWGRDGEKAKAYAAEMSERLGIDVQARAHGADVVGPADVVVTTTPSTEPVLLAEWLEPGVHVTAMGSDSAGKNELDPKVLAKADRLIVDKREQCIKLGELRTAVESGAVPQDVAVTELGELTSGSAVGRDSAQQITVCDLTGTGVQDTAIATVAYRKAASKGYGVLVET
jgi:ornithine cyclodeaminase